MQLPDALSRQQNEILLDLNMDYITFSDTQLVQVYKETKSCPVVCTVYRITHHILPAMCRQTPRMVHKYRDMRVKPTSDNILLLKGSRILIATVLWDFFLHSMHEEHAGITKCPLMACSLTYWPGIWLIHQASPTFSRLLLAQPVESLINHKVLHSHSQKIGTDILDLYGKRCLFIVHYFSKYPFFFKYSQPPQMLSSAM